MQSSFQVLARRNTWIYALDPRVKLAFVVTMGVLTFLWPRIEAALMVSLACVAALTLARVPAHRIAAFLRGVLPLLFLVVLLTALFGSRSERAWWGWGPFNLGPLSLYRGGLLAARLLALGLVFFVWLSTTDQGAMVRGFVALGLRYEWGLTIALAFRYLPILAELFAQVRDAQAARGLDLARGGLRARLAAYRPVLVAVIIGALRQAEFLGWALEARALGAAGAQRSTYCPLTLRRRDYAVLLFLLLLLTGAVLLRML